MSEKHCENPALFRFTWPGKDEACICTEHAGQLQNVAQAMGMHLQLIVLTPEEIINSHCNQII